MTCRANPACVWPVLEDGLCGPHRHELQRELDAIHRAPMTRPVCFAHVQRNAPRVPRAVKAGLMSLPVSERVLAALDRLKQATAMDLARVVKLKKPAILAILATLRRDGAVKVIGTAVREAGRDGLEANIYVRTEVSNERTI